MKKHRFALLLAAVCGLIVGLPHILIPRIIAPATYDPLQFISNEGSSITMEEVYTYVPEVKEILEGKFWVTDTQVYEYNGRPTPFIGETGLAWIMAGLSVVTGSMENAFIAADFIFPALTFLLTYAIVWILTKNRIVSSTAGAIVVLWPELVVLFPYPGALFSAAKSAFSPRDFLFISRNFHPQLSLPAYLLAFWCLLRLDLFAKRSNLSKTIIAGLTMGFLFYTYIFSWTAFVFGIAIFTIFVAVKRSDLRIRRSDLMKFLTIGLVVGLISFSYFFQIWQFKQSGLTDDFFLKLSLPKRGFFGLIARHLIFLLLFAYAKRKRWTWKEVLFSAFWLSPILMPDLAQTIFGRDLEGKHWVRRIAYPWSIMGLTIIVDSLRFKKLFQWASIAVILVVVAYGITVQVSMSKRSAYAYARNQQQYEFYQWVNENTQPGFVITSLDWDKIVNIPAKTHAFNFSPIGMRTIASTDEALDRFLWTAALNNKSDEWVREAFGDNGIGTTRVYYFMFADGDAVFRTPPDKVNTIIPRYQDIQKRFINGEQPPFKLEIKFDILVNYGHHWN